MASSNRTAKEELIAQDIKRLHGLGYAQELFRAMGGFSNFAISFTIISILSGCVTLFYLIPSTSGFAAASIGWPLVTVFVVIVALGMAELASASPLPVVSITGLPNLVLLGVEGLPGAGILAGLT